MRINSGHVRVQARCICTHTIRIFYVFSIPSAKTPTKIRIKTLSLGVVIPDVTFRLAKENARMALFSPYDVERIYGKPFGDIAVSERYDELVADERVRKNTLTPANSSSGWPRSSLSLVILTSCLKIR